MKILRVGDPHAKVSNLEEMRKLISFVLGTAVRHKVDRIEILGDLFHSHSVVRLEVQEFWTWALRNLASSFQTVVLVGNHDLSGDYSSGFSALSVFSLIENKNLVIVERPLCLGAIGYVPYTHNTDKFISHAEGLHLSGAKILVCHQTIQGSRYETGLYAPDGIELGEWSKKFTHIISGHIHAEQEFANVIYPGTGRWDTSADANQRKGIWIFEHNIDGTILHKDFISTEFVCRPIVEITYSEGDPEPKLPDNAKISIAMVGTSDWIAKEKGKFQGKASVKTKFTDVKKSSVRQTGKSFVDFLNNIYVTTANKPMLEAKAREMGLV